MAGYLRTGGPIPVAQLAADIFPCLGQKRQDRLVAFLAFILRVVTLAPAPLVAEQGVHGGVGYPASPPPVGPGLPPTPVPACAAVPPAVAAPPPDGETLETARRYTAA